MDLGEERVQLQNIIKGQMGMHMEYAIPICHEKLMDSGLRDYVVFMGSGGIRTWGDIIKGIAMGLDGVILGTADLVAIGCVRDRNCESGCRSGISTINPKMQLLRDVELNTRQVINFRAALQAQVARAIAALGMKDVRQLRGRYEYLKWPSLEERVQGLRHHRLNPFFDSPSTIGRDQGAPAEEPPVKESIQSPSDCGVAAIVSNRIIPSHVMDLMLDRMANRGMDGVGIWKGGCYPDHMDHYALHLLVKGIFQDDIEAEHLARDLGLHPRKIRQRAREKVLAVRMKMLKQIMEKYFTGLEVEDDKGDLKRCRIPYRRGPQGGGRRFSSVW